MLKVCTNDAFSCILSRSARVSTRYTLVLLFMRQEA